MTAPIWPTGPNTGGLGPQSWPITVPDPLCGHLPGECDDPIECAYWRGVVVGWYAPPALWSVTPNGVEVTS